MLKLWRYCFASIIIIIAAAAAAAAIIIVPRQKKLPTKLVTVAYTCIVAIIIITITITKIQKINYSFNPIANQL